MPIKQCKHCGKDIYVKPCSVERTKYCSKECLNADRYIEYACDCCGKVFSVSKCKVEMVKNGIHKHLYCSKDCANNAQRNSIVKKCEQCGKEYTVFACFGDIQKFCSKKCYYEFKRENKKRSDIKCLYCGKVFHPLRKNHIFCSNECKFAYKNESVKCSCGFCGKEIIKSKWEYSKNNNHYCSKECASLAHHEIVKCLNCGKETDRKIGEHKKFCCHSCALEYGIKHTKWHLIHGKNFTSKPQEKIDLALHDLGIKNKKEKTFGFYLLDNYLDCNAGIEVMGDYWHCSPLKFSKSMNETQFKNIKRDKAKNTYLKKYYGISPLYLWELDITNNINLCKLLIQKYVMNDGILPNYHSFNYEIRDNTLVLKTNLITPYQDMSVDLYRNLIV